MARRRSSYRKSTGLLNSRDPDKRQIVTMEMKEVRQDVQSMKTNMQMDRAHNATPEQSIDEFRKSKDGNQSERNKGLIGMTCKCLSHQSALNVDIDVFDGNVLEFNYFVSIFEKIVENNVVDPSARLARLINHNKGCS